MNKLVIKFRWLPVVLAVANAFSLSIIVVSGHGIDFSFTIFFNNNTIPPEPDTLCAFSGIFLIFIGSFAGAVSLYRILILFGTLSVALAGTTVVLDASSSILTYFSAIPLIVCFFLGVVAALKAKEFRAQKMLNYGTLTVLMENGY